MPTIDLEPLTTGANAIYPGEWGSSAPVRLSNRHAWEKDLIQVTSNLDRKQSFWLHFFSAKREWFSLLVLDAYGNTVMNREKRCREGHNLVSLDASSLESGTYHLRILTDGKVLSGTLKL